MTAFNNPRSIRNLQSAIRHRLCSLVGRRFPKVAKTKLARRLVHCARQTYLSGLSMSPQREPRGSLRGKTCADGPLNRFGEYIDLVERCVNVWGDADAAKFVVNDRRDDDVMLVPEVRAELRHIHALDGEQSEPA